MPTMSVRCIGSRVVTIGGVTELSVEVNGVDDAGNPLDRVRVRTLIEHDTEDFSALNSRLTDETGTADFRVPGAPAGLLIITPKQLIKETYIYDPSIGVKSAVVVSP